MIMRKEFLFSRMCLPFSRGSTDSKMLKQLCGEMDAIKRLLVAVIEGETAIMAIIDDLVAATEKMQAAVDDAGVDLVALHDEVIKLRDDLANAGIDTGKITEVAKRIGDMADRLAKASDEADDVLDVAPLPEPEPVPVPGEPAPVEEVPVEEPKEEPKAQEE